MHCSSLLSLALLSAALPLFTVAEHHGPSAHRHTALANRKRTELELQEFHRRDNNARATFYDVGLGACGKTNVPSDFIVALNSCEFGGGFPGPHCFKMITIEYQGKQTQAQITDECPGCPCGGLDMSTGLFKFFADESIGVFYMNWWYNDGGDSGGSPPAPSSSKKPKPTSTWTPPATTSSSKWVDPSPWTSQTSTESKSSSTWSSSSSSTSQWSSSSASWNSTSTSYSSTSTSSSAYPTPTSSVGGTAGAPQNLQDLGALVAELGKYVVQFGS